MEKREIDRGFVFADKLCGLVSRYGPADLSISERDALASHLVSVAVEWVKARNRSLALSLADGSMGEEK